MKVFYNEIEPYAALWLRNLSKDGRIPPGLVDERSISDVQGSDLAGIDQAHFFAGIGGWPLALEIAGWGDRPVWTGSCPCQPFSVAGNRKGEKDERHLWPEFRRLIAERRPPTVFGEQVASRLGREWLAGVQADMEALGYAVAAADLCAASIGAPHIRQRLYWVAERLDDASSARRSPEGARAEGEARNEARLRGPEQGRCIGWLGNPGHQGRQGNESEVLCDQGWREERRAATEPSAAPGHWDAYDLILCADGRARRIEPGLAPLAHGVPARVGKLRAYGNAIVPPLAARFVRAYLEVRLS